MKKLNLLFLLGILGVVSMFCSSSQATSRFDQGYYTEEVDVSSSVVFNGPGWVKSIYASTGTAGGQWFVMIDSGAATPLAPFSAFTSAQKKTPAIEFTTGTTNAFGGTDTYLKWTAPEPGVFISSGCFIYKTNASSGEALKVFVTYTK